MARHEVCCNVGWGHPLHVQAIKNQERGTPFPISYYLLQVNTHTHTHTLAKMQHFRRELISGRGWIPPPPQRKVLSGFQLRHNPCDTRSRMGAAWLCSGSLRGFKGTSSETMIIQANGLLPFPSGVALPGVWEHQVVPMWLFP